MLFIRGPDQVRRIDDPAIRHLVERRYAEVCNGQAYDHDIHGEMIDVEDGCTLAALERESFCPIARNPFDDIRFPDADFVPTCEYLESRRVGCEALYVLSDDGAGVNFFIPKQGIDADLLTLCARFAVPAAD